MTRKEYKKLCEDYKEKVSFVWSHWIDESLDYSFAANFCQGQIKEEAQISSIAIANLYE